MKTVIFHEKNMTENNQIAFFKSNSLKQVRNWDLNASFNGTIRIMRSQLETILTFFHFLFLLYPQLPLGWVQASKRG